MYEQNIEYIRDNFNSDLISYYNDFQIIVSDYQSKNLINELLYES